MKVSKVEIKLTKQLCKTLDANNPWKRLKGQIISVEMTQYNANTTAYQILTDHKWFPINWPNHKLQNMLITHKNLMSIKMSEEADPNYKNENSDELILICIQIKRLTGLGQIFSRCANTNISSQPDTIGLH